MLCAIDENVGPRQGLTRLSLDHRSMEALAADWLGGQEEKGDQGYFYHGSNVAQRLDPGAQLQVVVTVASRSRPYLPS